MKNQDTVTCPSCLKKTLDRTETEETVGGWFAFKFYKLTIKCSNLFCRCGWSVGGFKRTLDDKGKTKKI